MAGLASRRWDVIPSWVGDLLWAVAVFLVLSTVAPRLDLRVRAVVSLGACCLVELSQLYRDGWIDRIRANPIGHLLLGQGFDWTDLVAYTAGVGFAVLVDVGLLRTSDAGTACRSNSQS